MYLPFKQKCLHRQRRRKTSSSQLEQGVEWQRLQFHGKRSVLCGAQGERGEQYRKGHQRILRDTILLAGSFYLCNGGAEKAAPSPKGLSVHTRFLSEGLLYTWLPDVRVGFSFDCLRTTRSSRGRNASDAAAATRPCQQDPGLLPRNTCLHTGMLCSLPPGPTPGNGSHRRCASPSHAAGAGKRRRGGSCCCSADFSAPLGDFELTSGGCRVRQLEQQAGCAQLPQEVPDLLPRPC